MSEVRSARKRDGPQVDEHEALRRAVDDGHLPERLDVPHRLGNHRDRSSGNADEERLETAALSGAILLIIGTATAMGWALAQSGFSRQLAAAMAAAPGGGFGFLLISIVAFVVLGSVLEGIPAIVLFGPLLFPIARAAGIHEVHYAMVVILAMGIGLFAPPLGVGYYAACAIGRVSPDAGMKRIWPYLGALLAGLIAVAAIPWLSTGFL